MTNEEAILRLGQDTDDDSALVAIVENNLGTLRAAIKRCFCGRAGHNRLLNALLIRISWRAKYFIRGHDHGDEWIASCAETECKRLRNELGDLRSGPSRKLGTKLATLVPDRSALRIRTSAQLTRTTGNGRSRDQRDVHRAVL
jgi:hypothetical protein